MTRRRVVALLVLALAGLPAALVWLWLGDPSEWLMTERGLALTEENATGQFQVVAVFMIIGAVLGVVGGVLVERRSRPAQWPMVFAVALAATAASVLCWAVGVTFGPPDHASVKGVEVLELVPAQFAVDTLPAFVVWPLAAVLGYTASLWFGPDDAEDADDRERIVTGPATGVSDRSAP